MNAYNYPRDIPPDSKGYLVSTAKGRNNNSVIIIHTLGPNTTNYFCNVFYMTNIGEKWTFLENQYAMDYKSSVERGWFRDIAVFT